MSYCTSFSLSATLCICKYTKNSFRCSNCNELTSLWLQCLVHKKLLSLLHFFHCLHNPHYFSRGLFGLGFLPPFRQLMLVCIRIQNIHVNNSLTGKPLIMLWQPVLETKLGICQAWRRLFEVSPCCDFSSILPKYKYKAFWFNRGISIQNFSCTNDLQCQGSNFTSQANPTIGNLLSTLKWVICVMVCMEMPLAKRRIMVSFPLCFSFMLSCRFFHRLTIKRLNKTDVRILKGRKSQKKSTY